MKKIIKYLQKVHFVFIVFPIIQMKLDDYSRYGFETKFYRILLIPVLLLTIYLAYLDLKSHEESEESLYRSFRCIGLDVIMILFSIFGVIITFA